MSKAILSDLDFGNVARITNLPDATAPQQPATLAQVNAAVEGLAWKDSVRVATTSNINLAAPGASLDGVTMVANDRFLPMAQTTAAQNGIYIWNGAAVPARGIWNTIKKAADQSKTSNATLANDTDLVVPLLASTKYAIRGLVFFDTGATGDFKWRHVGPASPTLVRILRQWVLPGGTAFAGIAIDTAFSAADLALAGTGTNGGVVAFDGIIHNGANAGSFAFAWAQNTSDAVATIVRAGSYIDWAQI